MTPLHAIGTVDVDRCRSCGFVQVRRIYSVDELNDIYSDSYFDHRKYRRNWASRREEIRRLGVLARCDLQPGARLLDAGCATGDFLLTARQTFNVWGNDLSEYAVEQARRRMPDLAERIVAASLETANHPPEYFDAIVLWDVVEHLPDPLATLRKLVGKLRPGGLLAMSTPNIDACLARFLGSKWPFMTPPEHQSLFGRRTMRLLLDRLDLDEVYWNSRGKWTTLGFGLYKLGRIFQWLASNKAYGHSMQLAFQSIPVYIPSGDVQYVAAVRRR